MTKPADDLEAIRLVVQALEPFDSKDRERIIRWAAEKLGMDPMPVVAPPSVPSPPPAQHSTTVGPSAAGSPPKDIRSFVMEKNPKFDNHMAAVVAYFYHFEAAPTERKDAIGKDELVDACRKSDRKRPARPEQVLVNSYHAGLLDKAATRGHYRLNSVGENLVAMVLPGQEKTSSSRSRKPKTATGKQIFRNKAKEIPSSTKTK